MEVNLSHRAAGDPAPAETEHGCWGLVLQDTASCARLSAAENATTETEAVLGSTPWLHFPTAREQLSPSKLPWKLLISTTHPFHLPSHK